MVEIKRVVKLVTEQRITDKPPEIEGFPMRAWSIRIYLLNEAGQETEAKVFEKVKYMLHPSFKNPIHVKKEPPFTIQEEGWGEFDMEIILTPQASPDIPLRHDLNFQHERYESKHVVSFKNPKPALLALLRESGSAGAADDGGTNGVNGGKKSRDGGDKKKAQRNKGGLAIDMERLAEGLQELQEDDLLHVVQMVHVNKSTETYARTDVEQGEFHVDLYTLPDHLVKMLWEFTSSKVDI